MKREKQRLPGKPPEKREERMGLGAEITGYKVYYRLMSGGTLTKDNGNVGAVTDDTKRMAVVSGLSNGVEYQFAITALNEVGEGALSAIGKLTLRPEREPSASRPMDLRRGIRKISR